MLPSHLYFSARRGKTFLPKMLYLLYQEIHIFGVVSLLFKGHTWTWTIPNSRQAMEKESKVKPLRRLGTAYTAARR